MLALIDEASKNLLQPTSVAAVLGAMCLILMYALYKMWSETIRLNKIIFDVQKEASDHHNEATTKFLTENQSWRELFNKFADSLKG